MAEFSKLLTKTDIQKRLSLPAKCFKPLPSLKGSHGRDFPAIDESDLVWTFQCSTRKKGHPKPVLSKGWLAFVRHKELSLGTWSSFSRRKPKVDQDDCILSKTSPAGKPLELCKPFVVVAAAAATVLLKTQ